MSGVTKPKVTFVCESLVTSTGGAERVLCDLANHLAEAGFDVDVVTHEKASGRPFYPLSDKVRYLPLRPLPASYGPVRRGLVEPLRDGLRDLYHALRLNRVPGIARLGWIDRQGMFWRRLGRYLEQNPRDVAIAFMPRAMVALSLAQTDRPLARIASTHTTPERDFGPASDDAANVYMAEITRLSLHAFHRITVLQSEFRDWYPPDLRTRTTVVTNSIAPVTPSRSASENLILAVGRLVPVKGHEILIDAFARIAGDFPDWSLEIYGQGPDRAALQSRIETAGLSRRVRLMGTTRDIQKHYARAALLAHPSWIEGFSLVAGEALAAGLPVIGFADCPGVNDLVRDGENGVLVPGSGSHSGRVHGLAVALSSLMSAPDRRAALGQAAPASVTRFAAPAIMAQWQALIQNAAAQVRSER